LLKINEILYLPSTPPGFAEFIGLFGSLENLNILKLISVPDNPQVPLNCGSLDPG
jgi:hypothetical protein